MKYRKCPNCKQKDFTQNQVYDKIMRCSGDSITTTMRVTECGSFQCHNCGFEERGHTIINEGRGEKSE